MRTSHGTPAARASRQLPTAASSEPACSAPVGEGAKRPATISDSRATKENAARVGGVRERCRCQGAWRLPIAIIAVAVLTLAAFTTFLRFDGERRDRARFEALHADLLAGLEAVAVRAVFDALQRLVDLADQLALAIARAQLEAEFLFLRGAVVRVREVSRLVLHVRHGAVDFFHEVALPAVEDVAEVLELLLVHVRLATLGDVRRYIARAGEQAAGFDSLVAFFAAGRRAHARAHRALRMRHGGGGHDVALRRRALADGLGDGSRTGAR